MQHLIAISFSGLLLLMLHKAVNVVACFFHAVFDAACHWACRKDAITDCKI